MKRSIVRVCALMWAFGCSSERASAVRIGPAPPTLEVPRLARETRAQPQSGISFGRPRPAIGAGWEVSVLAESRASDQRSDYESAYRVRILGTNGTAASRVEVAVEKNVQRYQGIDKPTAIHGKTYEVEGSRVTDATGGVPSDDEVQRVLDVFPDLGTRSRIDQVLPETPMQVGDARDELAAAILYVIHPRAWSLAKGTAVLSRVDADEAVFTITLEATSAASGLRMTLHGDARIRTFDARLVELYLAGDYDHGSFTLHYAVRNLESMQ
jgi:hypothetical protein